MMVMWEGEERLMWCVWEQYYVSEFANAGSD